MASRSVAKKSSLLACKSHVWDLSINEIVPILASQLWNGTQAVAYRRAYLGHRFDELPLCKVCKVDRVKEVEFMPWKAQDGGITN